MLIHRVLFTGVTLAVWLGHRRALRAGGYGFARFWNCAWARMNWAWRQMNPCAYRWQPMPEHFDGEIQADRIP